MIEPSGMKIDVLGLPNRQGSKVAAYAGGKGQKQPDARAMPNVSGAIPAMGDDVPGHTVREMPARDALAHRAQDAGSVVATKFAVGGQINKGAPEHSGHTPVGGGLRTGFTKVNSPDADPGVSGNLDSQAGLKQGDGVALAD